MIASYNQKNQIVPSIEQYNQSSFKIDSYLIESCQVNKNNRDRKVTAQMNNNSNPFFQYVNNNKSVTGLAAGGQGVDYGLKQSVGNNKQNERKGSDSVASDPRKPPTTSTVALQPSKPAEEAKKLSTETRSQNDDLRQKRSRSRQGKVSKNRDESQQSNRKEKKQEHFHKTKLCPLYEKGECKKGAQCHFAHGFKQLRGLPNFYKTRLCLLFQKGECKKSIVQCKYAHGQNDLRDLRHDAGYSNTIPQSGNQINVRQSNERDRKNLHEDKRKKYERNSQDNRNDKRGRESDTNHRRDKHRDGSSDRRRKPQKTVQNVLGYKKNIPLNKQYEKFLYNNDPESKSQYETHNSMYMIPSGLINSARVPSSYEQDLYSVNQKKQGDKPNTMPFPQQQPNYPQINAKSSYKQFPISLPYNYPDQQSINSKPYYQNSSSTYKQFPQQPPFASNSKPQDKFPQQPQQHLFTQQILYAPNQPYSQLSNDYPSQFYQPPSNEFVSDFSKDLKYNKVSFSESYQQNYRNQSVKNVFSQDNRFDGGSQGQRNLLPIIDKPSQQGFYNNNDSFYPPTPGKITDTNFLSPNQPPINSYQTIYSKNGVYDLYPALDNSGSTNQSQKYPYPYEKSRFSSFSNNPQK